MFSKVAILIAYICMYQSTEVSPSLKDEKTAILIAGGVQSYYQCQAEAAYIHDALANGIPVAGVPSTPIQANDVTFKLWTRKNPLVPQTLQTSDSIAKSFFNAKRLTVLYSSGMNASYKDVQERFSEGSIKTAANPKVFFFEIESLLSPYIFTIGLLPSHDINLIATDWDSYALKYNKSYTRNVTAPRVAKFVAQFIELLYDHGANAKQMCLIGISTGGQIVGLASKYIRPCFPRISRIIAVDPVGTCYNYLPSSQKLTRTDADFVELMHCSVGDRGVPLDYYGSVTFYMEGGVVQTPCLNQTDLTELNRCNHVQCQLYFFQSLQNFNLSFGVKCDSFEQYNSKTCDCRTTALLGFYTPSWVNGLYFVDMDPFSATSNNENCASRKSWF